MTHAPEPQLVVQPAPFLRPQVSTPRIMGDVLIALAPATAAGIWFFGLSALLVVLAATAASPVPTKGLPGSAGNPEPPPANSRPTIEPREP